jgi:hypothetical protein
MARITGGGGGSEPQTVRTLENGGVAEAERASQFLTLSSKGEVSRGL